MAETTPGYIVCTHPRSGSTVFCQMLASTGKLGNPDEYFSQRHLQRAGVTAASADGLPEYVTNFQRQTASPNGVAASKMFWFDLEPLIRIGVADRFASYRFVFLQRKDKLAQAISIRRAWLTGITRSDRGTSSAPETYDYADIKLRLTRLLNAEANWRAFFDAKTLKPVDCVYEDIMQDPQAAVDRIAQSLGLTDRALIAPDQVTLRIQRDGISKAWHDRFLAEACATDPEVWALFQRRDVAPPA